MNQIHFLIYISISNQPDLYQWIHYLQALQDEQSETNAQWGPQMAMVEFMGFVTAV